MGRVTASTIGKVIGSSWDRAVIPADLGGYEWYVLWVMPKMARRAVERLRRLGIEAYVPLKSQTVIPRARRGKSQKPVTSLVPAFPGYVFVGLLRKSLFGVATAVDGVIDFLRHEGAPVQLRSSVMTDVIEHERDGTLDDPKFRIVVGDTVLVTEGAFAGYIGKVRRIAKRAERKAATDTVALNIEFDVFGRTKRARIMSNCVTTA